MGASNTKGSVKEVFTHGGSKAVEVDPLQMLRRSVLSCLLFEKEYYEDGVEIAKRIEELCGKVKLPEIASLAIEARQKYHLRHIPLYLTSVLSDLSHGTPLVSDTVFNVVQRADELTELLAIHAVRKGAGHGNLKKVMSHGLKNGLARAFGKFDAYALGKYNRDNPIKLRDVLFLTHSKPANPEQKALWGKLIDGSLESPDTWEVELSAGKDKKDTFERLIYENKLGYLALLRNLRNMAQAGCDTKIVKNAILARKGGAEKVLPFRFIAAARYAPQFERELDDSLMYSIKHLPELKGKTVVMVDVSGSMHAPLSGKSDLNRSDAAAALASVINAEELRVFSFANRPMEVPPRKGMAGIAAIVGSQSGGTNLFRSVSEINKNVKYDRIIIITDEQDTSGVGSLPDPVDGAKGYIINVASNKNGVGYRRWTHIDGFSENVIRYIIELEAQ